MINKENHEIKQRLKKLKQLADRGIGGEKESAALLLNKLCKKHGISMLEINDEQIFTLELGRKDSFKHILGVAILLKTFGEKFHIDIEDKRQKLYASFETTAAIFADLEGLHSLLWKHYEAEKVFFDRAFISNHGLSKNVEKDWSEFTQEEIEEIKRTKEFKENIHTKQYRRQID